MKKYCILITLALLSGCASAPQKKIETVFYPPAPELPRLQFLRSLSGEKDIAPKKSAFQAFVTGVNESQRAIDKPYGVAISKGKIYVCDINQGLMVFDLNKKTFGQYPGSQGQGRLLEPINIRIGSDGTKYVTDTARDQVVIFDKNDFYINAFGDPETWKPVDAVPYQDEIYVVDIKNGEIVVLDKNSGKVLRKWGKEGEPVAHLVKPTNLAFNTEGHIYVSDVGRFQIVEYDRDGHYLGKFGDIGMESGFFARPKGIATDDKDRIYVVDAAFGNVQLFNKAGRILFFFGQTGIGPGDMNLPAQVVVDHDNIRYFEQFADPNFMIESLIIVTNQAGHNPLNIYALGRARGKHYPTDTELMQELKTKAQKLEKGQSPANKPEIDKQKQ
ncbi:MAG TPA: hypothetical protein VEI57_12910 [Nitrospirota bacterium]|nr:hypothetical protein [Nitrospirota bacterium]